MSEAHSRRQFLTRDIPAMAYGVATAPSLFQPHDRHREVRYGVYEGSKFRAYSWRKIQRLLGLRQASEDAFYQRLEERYAEITAAYNNATGNGGLPDFKQLFGLDRDRYFAPPTRDIPKPDMSRLLKMSDILNDDAKKVRQIKDRLTYEDIWSLNARNFADGNRVITPGKLLPIHRNGAVEDTYFNNEFLVWQYSDGTCIWEAIFIDADDGPSYTSANAPAEYMRAQKIRQGLNERIRLSDITADMIEARNILKQEFDDLMGSQAVKNFLKDRDEATAKDMVPDYVSFDHPYVVSIHPATTSGLSEADLKDPSKYYYEFGGRGIFQRDVYEHIEVPGSSPFGVHAGKFWVNETSPYRKKFRLKDLPKEDADLLKAYFASVTASFKRADEVLAGI